MFNKKNFFILLLLVVAIGTIATVSASDVNQTDAIASSVDTTDVVAVSNDDVSNEVAVSSDDVSNKAAATKEDSANILSKEINDDSKLSVSNAKAVKISVPKAVKYFGAQKSTKVVVKDKSGKAVSDVPLKIRVYTTGSKYKTINAKTNAKGVAAYQIPNSLSVGKHKVLVYPAGTKFTSKPVTSYIYVKARPVKLYVGPSTVNDVKGVVSMSVDKISNKYINGLKLKVSIKNKGKWVTKVLTTGPYKGSSATFYGVTAYFTNMFTAGTHAVKFKVLTKGFTGSKTSKMVIPSIAKTKYYPWYMYISGGKMHTYVNGKTSVSRCY